MKHAGAKRITRKVTLFSLLLGLVSAALLGGLISLVLLEEEDVLETEIATQPEGGTAASPTAAPGGRTGPRPRAPSPIFIPISREPPRTTFRFPKQADFSRDFTVPEAASAEELFALAKASDRRTPGKFIQGADAVSKLLRSPEGTEYLSANLLELTPMQRGWAVDLVGFQGSTRHVPLLRAAMTDPHAGVRDRAEAALKAVQARQSEGGAR